MQGNFAKFPGSCRRCKRNAGKSIEMINKKETSRCLQEKIPID